MKKAMRLQSKPSAIEQNLKNKKKRLFFLLKIISILIIIILIENQVCIAGKIAYIDEEDEASQEYQQLKMVCDFYGIAVQRIKIEYINETENIERQGGQVAYVINAGLMGDDRLIKFMKMMKGKRVDVPFLITGVDAKTNDKNLKIFFGNQLINVRKANPSKNPPIFKFASQKDLCRELAGHNISLITDSSEKYWLEIGEISAMEPIISFTDEMGEKEYPMFVRLRREGMNFFLATGGNRSAKTIGETYLSSCSKNENYQKCFLESAPLFLFVRYVFGDECWHAISDFANLTIDDPRLIERYGGLDFEGLIKEIGKNDFHTTIGFIPWNYDRNSKQVVDLILKNKNKMSLVVHGNSHAHREFGYYDPSIKTDKDKSIYAQQEKNIQQALARMEEFKNLTGLSYDKIMIFPHDISPEPTLGLLRKYGFVATVNSSNIPWGSERREDSIERLRVATRKYEDFPSFKRMAASNTLNDSYKSGILIDLFLDNPILLSSHADFFREGVGAFEETARFINGAQPEIRWRALGGIAAHGYLIRKIRRGIYDVFSFVDSFILENRNDFRANYRVCIPMSDTSRLKSLEIDGRRANYEAKNKAVKFSVTLEPEESKRIILKYADGMETPNVPIAREGMRNIFLRSFSEFRDMYLVTWKPGYFLVKSYYDTGIFNYGLWSVGGILGFFIVILSVAIYLGVTKGLKRRKDKLRNSA
jgi:hypothetical protein